MSKKQYKEYEIDISDSGWTSVWKNGSRLATVIDEEEARRVIWIDSGKGDYITADMLVPVSPPPIVVYEEGMKIFACSTATQRHFFVNENGEEIKPVHLDGSPLTEEEFDALPKREESGILLPSGKPEKGEAGGLLHP